MHGLANYSLKAKSGLTAFFFKVCELKIVFTCLSLSMPFSQQKPKIFTTWPFMKKSADPWPTSLLLIIQNTHL